MSFFLWNILLAVNWALLTGQFNLENLVAGFVIGFLLLMILRQALGQTDYFPKVRNAIAQLTRPSDLDGAVVDRLLLEARALLEHHTRKLSTYDVPDQDGRLRAAGYDPKAMTVSGDEWGPRAEPDLVMRYAGQTWPVEVQREIRTRNNEKWEKTLELSGGYLILILESEGERSSQVEILRRAGLPGTILATSLERLREGEGPQDWDCVESGQ